MCGRYFVTTPGHVLGEQFSIVTPPELVPRYNVAPTQSVAIVRAGGDRARELAQVTWGLIPAWSKERAIGHKLINARGETLADKPAFRDSYKRRRCLIPADGFFEWQKVADGKQPWVLRLKSGEPFALAGLWSRWRDRESGDEVDSCTIVTTAANEVVAPLHDRMPVIVPRDAYALWLDPAIGERARLDALLVPYAAEAMTAYPVSRRVNSPANDDPGCIEPAA